MPNDDFTINTETAGVEALLRASPKIANAELNSGMRLGLGAFMRKFSREQLTGSRGIRVRRSISGKSRGPVKLPKAARAIGFAAGLRHPESIDRKAAYARNSNPVFKAHQDGKVIRPKRRSYLYVRVTTPAGRSKIKGAEKRKLPFVIRVTKEIRVKKRLRFTESFRAWARSVWPERLVKVADRIVRRIERFKSKGAA